MLNTTLEAATDFIIEEVRAKLENFNIKAIGANDTSGWFAYVTKNEDEKIIAASVFRVFWGQLHIRYLVVDQDYRSQKLGTLLMNKMIEWGKEHGCTIAHVETLSFQALDFYLKLGFVLEYTKTGYSHGVKFHYLTRNI